MFVFYIDSVPQIDAMTLVSTLTRSTSSTDGGSSREQLKEVIDKMESVTKNIPQDQHSALVEANGNSYFRFSKHTIKLLF